MKRLAYISLLLTAVLFLFSAWSVAAAGDADGSISAIARDLHELALTTAAEAGVTLPSDAAIKVHSEPGTTTAALTCSGWWDCAWLHWFCSDAGGITGFDQECYLPSESQESGEALAMFRELLPEIVRIEALDPSLRDAERQDLRSDFERLSQALTDVVDIHTDLVGVDPSPAAIHCDPSWNSCGCSNPIDCAWLGWFCAELGGISGFDDTCHLPATVGASAAIGQDIAARFPTLERPYGGLLPVPDGYVVEVPRTAARDLPIGRMARLTLRHPERGATTVSGLLVADDAGIRVETDEVLEFDVDDPRIAIEVTDSDGPFGPCWEAEFGGSCWITMCAGTTYCVPGPGPGGLTCRCI